MRSPPWLRISHHSIPLGKATLIVATVSALIVALPVAAAFASRESTRPPGLIQAGDSKTNCIYAGVGARLQQAEQATGFVYNCIETFNTNTPSWPDWVSPWVTHNGYGYNTWIAADPTGRQIIITQDLIPDNMAADSNWTAECAAGSYDTYATQLATNLVKTGFGYSVIRLGVEMNGTWNAGSLGTTRAEWKQWGECFAQEVQAMRAVPQSHLLFDWNVNANYRDIPLADFYPGNAYVNIIGIDAYDFSGISLPPVGSSGRWEVLASEPEGLNAVEAFAAAQGKPFSIPEWGTVSTQGDDADYVTNMGALVARNDVAFQSWFDAGDDDIFPLSASQAPLSLAAYIKAFG
jgi:Glycosyl hydrolase family 26